MAKHFKYTSVARIYAKLERDFGIVSFNEYDVIEWIGEALEKIGSINQYEEAVSFIEVENHQCAIPSSLVNIIQIARNTCFKALAKDCHGKVITGVVSPEQVRNCIIPQPTGLSPVKIDECGNPVADVSACPVLIDCHGAPITDVEVAYYRPFFDLQANYFGWTASDLHRNCFRPVRLTNNTMFNSLVCRLKDNMHDLAQNDTQVYQNEVDEYNVIDGEILRFSFKHGQIALSYNRIKLDEETGYPLMPDIVSVSEAISYYIQWKLSSREFYKGREGAEKKMVTAEAQWVFYCRQAGNELIQPHGIDDYQDLLDQWKYLVPQKDRYFGYFGKLNKPENTRQYDDPNYRDGNGFRIFRGAFMF